MILLVPRKKHDLSASDLRIVAPYHAVLLNISNDLVKLTKCKAYVAVSTAIVDCDLSACGIMNGRAGEGYVGNKAPFLIPLLGSEQEVFASVKNF